MRQLAVLFFAIIFASCANVQPLGLYDSSITASTGNDINGFAQTSIFEDDITADVWFTKEQKCLKVSNDRSVTQTGSGALHIVWNKQAGGCPWLGLGFGWDGWTGKDVSQILNQAAVSFYVRTDDKPMKALPWAIGFEDFPGNQKWIGVTEEWIVNGPIQNEWRQVLIPLSAFGLDKSTVDFYSIKQLMLQFESNGNVYIDNVEVIPYAAK